MFMQTFCFSAFVALLSIILLKVWVVWHCRGNASSPLCRRWRSRAWTSGRTSGDLVPGRTPGSTRSSSASGRTKTPEVLGRRAEQAGRRSTTDQMRAGGNLWRGRRWQPPGRRLGLCWTFNCECVSFGTSSFLSVKAGCGSFMWSPNLEIKFSAFTQNIKHLIVVWWSADWNSTPPLGGRAVPCITSHSIYINHEFHDPINYGLLIQIVSFYSVFSRSWQTCWASVYNCIALIYRLKV